METNKKTYPKAEPYKAEWSKLLIEAVEKPGKLMAAYTAFHSYSFGNVVLAWSQCEQQGIPLGPIASFKAWEKKGRRIKKGSRAIALCMPVAFKKEADAEAGTEEEFRRFFVFKRNWFVLSQTEGDDVKPVEVPGWSKEKALASLAIAEIPFDCHDGNIQGFASSKGIAINPLAQFPLKTLFHELAHKVLRHVDTSVHADDDVTPANIAEVEAESVALLLCASLGHEESLSSSRAYIQTWLGKGNSISDKSARRIFKAATDILKAGKPEASKDEQ